MNTELFLIRHGETDYNRQGRYCGFTDAGLNNNGVDQMTSLYQKGILAEIDLLFCSISRRAHQTAKILFPNKNILQAAALRELNFGQWEGLSYEQVVGQYSGIYSRWLKDPYRYSPPSGERLVDLEERAVKFLQSVFKNHSSNNKKIACVSHAGPIKVMTAYLLNNGSKGFWDLTIEPASFNRFVLKEGKLVSYQLNLS